jgi:hypothetical protein
MLPFGPWVLPMVIYFWNPREFAMSPFLVEV